MASKKKHVKGLECFTTLRRETIAAALNSGNNTDVEASNGVEQNQ
jgi:hypothetical protein